MGGIDSFGATQQDLVAVKTAARQRPQDVLSPKAFCHVIFLDADPDDQALAEENRRRAWPPQALHEGRCTTTS